MKKKNYYVTGVVVFVLLIVILVMSFAVKYSPNVITLPNNIVKSKKEVTITDKGIADSVDKLYDATVIVEIISKDLTKGATVTGWGSGFVYKTDDKYGYIFTNHHVVEKADSIKIVYTDESEVDGEVIGSDAFTDVAVIKVPLNSVKKVAEIGKSESVRVGDTVFAVGTPISLEYSFTVTRGILSGKNRMVEMYSQEEDSIFPFANTSSESWYMRLLQIDASINSGNSGGPLANANGEVIGITNSKLSSSTTKNIENIGFAIPIEDALTIANKLEKSGKVTRPLLGITTTSIEAADYQKIEHSGGTTMGSVVVSVNKGSTADDAGLKAGDVITKIGDYDVKNMEYLKYYLYRYQIGDKVVIKYFRDGKEHSSKVTLKG